MTRKPRAARPSANKTKRRRISDDDYRQLAAFRYAVRTFLEFSERAARSSGLTPQQHQALLAIRGLNLDGDAGMGVLAERLHIRHHSAVELVKRLVSAGLVRRRNDEEDRRRVLLFLTPKAEKILASLSATHLDELRRMRTALLDVIDLLKINHKTE